MFITLKDRDTGMPFSVNFDHVASFEKDDSGAKIRILVGPMISVSRVVESPEQILTALQQGGRA